MIAYEILVQTIADAKAGVRPSASTLPPIPSGAPVAVEEFSSGVVDFDEQEPEGYSEDDGYGEAEVYTEDQADGQYEEPAADFDVIDDDDELQS